MIFNEKSTEFRKILMNLYEFFIKIGPEFSDPKIDYSAPYCFMYV